MIGAFLKRIMKNVNDDFDIHYQINVMHFVYFMPDLRKKFSLEQTEWFYY